MWVSVVDGSAKGVAGQQLVRAANISGRQGYVLDTDAQLNLSMLALMQKRLQGTIFGGGTARGHPRLLSMYQAGKLNIDDMVTRLYRLDQINEGYHNMLEGRNIRGVIRFTDADW